MRINPQLLSTQATHLDRTTHRHVKVIASTEAYDMTGKKCYSAEIMSGPDAGKYTTVYGDSLVPLFLEE